MLDKLFFLVLILNATGLFRFLAPLMDVSISRVSMALLGINVLYLFVKLRYASAVFLHGGMGGWLFVLLVWPLFTLFYAPSFEAREVGLQLYFCVLFFGAVVYTASNGLPAMYRLLYVSLAITVVGLILSMISPQYFAAVAELADARVEGQGRACGFLLQPNSLAAAMIFLFIGWFALWERKNTLLQVAAILGFLLLMLLTGSRTGILAAVIVAAFILAPTLKKGLPSGKHFLMVSVLIVCLAGGVAGMRYYLSQVENTDIRREDLVNRMQTMLSFRLSDHGGISDDGSIRERLVAQAVYWSLIKEKPLLGHGLGSDTYYQENGSIFLSAHSQAIACAMEYGVLYPIVCCLLTLQLYRKRGRRDVERVFQTNSIGQFVFILMFLFLINGGLFESRTFYVVLGMFFAAVCCPRYIFSHDESTGRISGVLTRREIAGRFAGGKKLQKRVESSMREGNAIAPEGGAGG